jgi:plasmid stability protein
MATIQVREIPEQVYEVIRRRARAEGKSIQVYMRDQIIALASRPAKGEALAVIEAALEKYGPLGASPDDIVRDLHADRR